jgi:hypothetical protein
MGKTRLGRRLDRVEGALAVARRPTEAADEARELATEVAEAFRSMVGHYRQHYSLSDDEARAKASECPDHLFDRALECPPAQLSWFELEAVAGRDPDRAAARWEEVKQAARGEVASGHRAARALEGHDSHCWSRARFLAIRAELSASWRPRTAAEQHLVDQMAQWQTLIWQWQESYTSYDDVAATRARRSGPDGAAGPRLQSDADRLEHAAGMVERFHRLYLRTLRALQDMRRSPPVVVRAAGQVNIGHQQVNVGGAGAS